MLYLINKYLKIKKKLLKFIYKNNISNKIKNY